jgi:hypothetical protein
MLRRLHRRTRIPALAESETRRGSACVAVLMVSIEFLSTARIRRTPW